MNRYPHRGTLGSPEFIEHAHQLGAIYRELRIRKIKEANGWMSVEIDNAAFAEAMAALPFEIIEDNP